MEIGFPLQLADFLECWQHTLRSRCKDVTVADLPWALIDEPEFSGLPCVSAIYFLSRQGRRILYVGRATNLWARWGVERCHTDTREIHWASCHGQLQRCLKYGDIRIYWLEVDRWHLAAVEVAMIAIHKPRWNVCRT